MGKPNSLAALAAKGKQSAQIAATHFRLTPSAKLVVLLCLVGVVLLSLAAALDARDVKVPGNGLRWLYFAGSVAAGTMLWSVLVELVYTWLELRYFLWLVMMPSEQLLLKLWLNVLAAYMIYMQLFEKAAVGGVPPQPLSTAESWVRRLLTCCLLFMQVCVLVTVASNLTITLMYSEGSRQKIAGAMQHAYVMYRLIRDKLQDEYQHVEVKDGDGGRANGAAVAPVAASAAGTLANGGGGGGGWGDEPADGADVRQVRLSHGPPSAASVSVTNLSPFAMRQRTRRRRTWRRVHGSAKAPHPHLHNALSHPHPQQHPQHPQQQPQQQHQQHQQELHPQQQPHPQQRQPPRALPQSFSAPHLAAQLLQQQQPASLHSRLGRQQHHQHQQQVLLESESEPQTQTQSREQGDGDGRAANGPRLRRGPYRQGSTPDGLAAGAGAGPEHDGLAAATAAEPAATAAAALPPPPPPPPLTEPAAKPGLATISIFALAQPSSGEGRGSVPSAADGGGGGAAAAANGGAAVGRPVAAAAASGRAVSFCSLAAAGFRPRGKVVADKERKAADQNLGLDLDSDSDSQSAGEDPDPDRDVRVRAAESISVSTIAGRIIGDTEMVHVRRTLLASLEIIEWLQERNEKQVRGPAAASRSALVTSHSTVRRELHAMRQYGVRQIVSPRALLDEMLVVYSRLSDSDIPLLARHFADAVWECAAPDGDTLRPEDFVHIFSRDDDRQIAWDALDGDKDGILTRGDVAASVATFLQQERSMALTVTAVRRLTRSLQISLIGIINGIFLMAAYLSILDLTHFLTGGNSSKTSLDIFSVYVLVVSLIFSEQIKQVLSGCILILTQQPFDIGEELVIEEAPGWRVMGIVQDFNLFFLRVKKSTDGELVTLPLSKLSTARFTNLTRSDWKIEQNYLAVDASTPPAVLAAITDAALAVIRATPGEYDVSYGFLAVYHGFDRPHKVVIRTFHRYKFNLAAPHKRIAQARHGVMAAVRQTLDKLGVEFTELRMHAPLQAGALPYPPGATAAADAAAAAAAAGYGIPPGASAPPDAATPAALDASGLGTMGRAGRGGLGGSWVPKWP